MQLVFFVFASFMYIREMNFVQSCAVVIHLPVCRVVFVEFHVLSFPPRAGHVFRAIAGAYAIR